MNLREWMNQNSAVVTIIAVVLLLVSLGVIIMTLTPKQVGRVVDVYFMDTDDGKLFVDKSDQLPPVVAPSGKDGVRAFIFSCSDCGDEASHFVGWLETYTPAAKKAIEAPVEGPEGGMDNYELIENGHMVADPVSKKWVPANSEYGFKIMDMIQNKCGDEAPKPCFPGR
ncbi:MAG TPA: hypothetical protein DCM28_21835 [Phycisphaerales bacterium]|nr:hypothetical protein [Phycisphaerales bacterium]HCD34565.1 hypothetical protein [Phycisphaerales bacterium]|tara:strand:+ start:1936 stop:2442 length:507 start_codon:yes stop_codon:yes gene_type:complete